MPGVYRNIGHNVYNIIELNILDRLIYIVYLSMVVYNGIIT